MNEHTDWFTTTEDKLWESARFHYKTKFAQRIWFRKIYKGKEFNWVEKLVLKFTWMKR